MALSSSWAEVPKRLKMKLSRPWITGPNMYKIAALLNAISIAGHTKYGYDYFYFVLDTIPDRADYSIGKYGAQYAWNYVNVTLAMAALLNWQWSLSGGPRTTFETLIFWIVCIMGAAGGYRYINIGAYQPLICLWYAPFFSLVGWWIT